MLLYFLLKRQDDVLRVSKMKRANTKLIASNRTWLLTTSNGVGGASLRAFLAVSRIFATCSAVKLTNLPVVVIDISVRAMTIHAG
jgi:hypothetical protein